VLVGWDSLETPTYRHEALPAYQSGREFEDSIVEQLALLPGSSSRSGSRSARLAATRQTTSSPRRRASGPAPLLVATSDRDAYQLVDDRVSILQPVKGVSELARIGPAEVRERYASSRTRCPTSSHSAATRPTRSPARRRRPEEGGDVLKQHGSLAQALADGRFPQLAEELLLYQSIATMDGDAPLPKLKPTPPDWSRAAAFADELGLGGLATKLSARA